MKKVIKSKMFVIFVTAIFVASGTLYAANQYRTSDVIYKASDGTNKNVNDALDELYNSCNSSKDECLVGHICTKCAAGTYVNKDNNMCSKCTAGTYSSEGSTLCTNCPSEYTSAAGSTSLNDCYMPPTTTKSSSNGNWTGTYTCTNGTCVIKKCTFRTGTVCNGGTLSVSSTYMCTLSTGESRGMKSYCNSSLANDINYGGTKGTSYINTSNGDYSYYGASLPSSYSQ